VVLTVGTGDTGQLGLGDSVMECKMPKLVSHLQVICKNESVVLENTYLVCRRITL